jgi:hypothetical protein
MNSGSIHEEKQPWLPSKWSRNRSQGVGASEIRYSEEKWQDLFQFYLVLMCELFWRSILTRSRAGGDRTPKDFGFPPFGFK